MSEKKITIEMVGRAYDFLSHPPSWEELDIALKLHINYLKQKNKVEIS